MISKVMNASTIRFDYDIAHNVISKQYSSTSGVVTPISIYGYDETTVDGKTIGNPIGKLTSEYTSLNNSSFKSIFSYGSDGNIVAHYQCIHEECPQGYRRVTY